MHASVSPRSQQLVVESQKGAAIPRIKKLDIAKRQSENVTPIPSKRAERGEVAPVQTHERLMMDSNF